MWTKEYTALSSGELNGFTSIAEQQVSYACVNQTPSAFQALHFFLYLYSSVYLCLKKE